MQEAVDADLLLHVVDASNPHHPEQMKEVARVLAEIGADQVPQILVFNKLDAIEVGHRPPHLEDLYELDGVPTDRLFVSARTGEGLDGLRHHLAQLAARPEPAERDPGYSLGEPEGVASLGTITPSQ